MYFELKTYAKFIQIFLPEKSDNFYPKNVSMTSDQNMTQVTKFVPRGKKFLTPPICIPLKETLAQLFLGGFCEPFKKFFCRTPPSNNLLNDVAFFPFCRSVSFAA